MFSDLCNKLYYGPKNILLYSIKYIYIRQWLMILDHSELPYAWFVALNKPVTKLMNAWPLQFQLFKNFKRSHDESSCLMRYIYSHGSEHALLFFFLNKQK